MVGARLSGDGCRLAVEGGNTSVRGWLQVSCGGWEHVCQGMAVG